MKINPANTRSLDMTLRTIDHKVLPTGSYVYIYKDAAKHLHWTIGPLDGHTLKQRGLTYLFCHMIGPGGLVEKKPMPAMVNP